MKLTHTNRGFKLFEFTDRYSQEGTIQMSSAACFAAIWLGVSNTGPLMDGPLGQRNEDVNSRLHLTREQVASMLPVLHHFVRFGELPATAEDQESMAATLALPTKWCERCCDPDPDGTCCTEEEDDDY